MFGGCAGLRTLPELPATTLVSSCYEGMFAECYEIKISDMQTDECWKEYRIPASGDGVILGYDCLTDMFIGTNGMFTDMGTPEINTTYYISDQRQYTLTYVTEHGTTPASITFSETTHLAVADLPVLTAEGYTFKGWSRTDGSETISEGFAIDADTTLYAVWEEAASDEPETPSAGELHLLSQMFGLLVGQRIAGMWRSKE